MGTILLKKGELAFGRYHLEVAIKQGHYNVDSVKNLNSSRELLNIVQFEELSPINQFTQIMYTAPIDFYLFFSLIVLVFGVVSWKKFTTKASKIIWLTIALVPLAFPLVFMQNNFAIITSSEQPVYEGPSEVFEKSNELPLGLKVVVKNNQDGWYKILSPNRFAGWVKKDSIILIKE